MRSIQLDGLPFRESLPSKQQHKVFALWGMLMSVRLLRRLALCLGVLSVLMLAAAFVLVSEGSSNSSNSGNSGNSGNGKGNGGGDRDVSTLSRDQVMQEHRLPSIMLHPDSLSRCSIVMPKAKALALQHQAKAQESNTAVIPNSSHRSAMHVPRFSCAKEQPSS